MGTNKGVAIVNIHIDTHSGGDTDDTVIRVVVVTVADSSDISRDRVFSGACSVSSGSGEYAFLRQNSSHFNGIKFT